MALGLRDSLLECLALLLRPLVRFCLRRSLKIQDFTESSKKIFIALAEAEIRASGATPSTSKLSIMTGLHRRDVMRLWKDQRAPKNQGSLFSRIIGQWQHDERFQTKQGKARLLEFEGKESEFVDLVQSVSKDLNPYTVLFELERIGAVVRVGTRLKLATEAYVPRGDLKESFSLLGADTEDLIQAVEENVFDGLAIPNLHVKTQYDNICEEFVPQIRNWFLDRGEALHREAREFLSQFDKDLNPQLKNKVAGVRVAVGTFSRIEEPTKPETKPTKSDEE
jgi:Family of unknown function (DUF6502)